MSAPRTMAVVVAGLALLGCSETPPAYLETPPEPRPPMLAPAAGTDAGDAPKPMLPDGAIRIDPLPSCEAGQVTTLHWSDAAVASGPIRFWIEGDPPALFAESASAGSKQTGPWASPGQRFLVTDAAGRTLVRLVVEAEVPCE